MDHYPEINVQERERASRVDSTASSMNKLSTQLPQNKLKVTDLTPPQYASFPPTNNANAEPFRGRTDSVDSAAFEDEAKAQDIDAEYAHFTDAPPPFSEKQYEGKSEEQQTKMRRADYAKEINRMMGKQLVAGLKSDEAPPEET